jgi:hypothetical protein
MQTSDLFGAQRDGSIAPSKADTGQRVLISAAAAGTETLHADRTARDEHSELPIPLSAKVRLHPSSPFDMTLDLVAVGVATWP